MRRTRETVGGPHPAVRRSRFVVFLTGLLLLAHLLPFASAVFIPDMTPETFDQYVKKRPAGTVAAVKVYAPWCQHCQTMEDDWNILGNLFADVDEVVVASVNGDKHVKLRESLGTTGYPSIYLYGADGADTPRDWKSARSWGALGTELKRMAKEAGGKLAAAADKIQLPYAPNYLEKYRAQFSRVSEKSPLLELTPELLSRIVLDRSRDVVLAVVLPDCPKCKALLPELHKAAASFVAAGHSPAEVVFATVDGSKYRDALTAPDVAEWLPSPPTSASAMPAVYLFPRGLQKKSGRVALPESKSPPTAAELVEFVNQHIGTEITVGGGVRPSAGRLTALDDIVNDVLGGKAFRAKYATFDAALEAQFAGVEQLLQDAVQQLERAIDRLVSAGTVNVQQGNFYQKTFEKLVDKSGKGVREIAEMIGRYERTLEEAPLKQTMQAMHMREFAKMRNLMRIFEEHSAKLSQQVAQLVLRAKREVAESVARDILDDKFTGDADTAARFADRVKQLRKARDEAVEAAARGKPARVKEAAVALAVALTPGKHVLVVPRGDLPTEDVLKVAERKLPDLVVVLAPPSTDDDPVSLAFYSKHDKAAAAAESPAPPVEPIPYTDRSKSLDDVLRFLDSAMQPPGKGEVVELTDKTFASVALDKSKTVMVAFVASWCGHCKRLKPEYRKAAALLERRVADKSSVVMATVDADQYGELREQFGVVGFPTIKVFRAGDNKLEDYEGGRTAFELAEYLKAAAEEDRSGTRPPEDAATKPSAVVELTPAELDGLLADRSKAVLLMLYAPWCGACKTLKPLYEKLAGSLTQTRPDIVLARLDADRHAAELEQRIKVEHYPTFRFWPKGGAEERRMDVSVDDLEYDEELSELRDFVLQHAGEARAEGAPISFRAWYGDALEALRTPSIRNALLVTAVCTVLMLALRRSRLFKNGAGSSAAGAAAKPAKALNGKKAE